MHSRKERKSYVIYIYIYIYIGVLKSKNNYYLIQLVISKHVPVSVGPLDLISSTFVPFSIHIKTCQYSFKGGGNTSSGCLGSKQAPWDM